MKTNRFMITMENLGEALMDGCIIELYEKDGKIRKFESENATIDDLKQLLKEHNLGRLDAMINHKGSRQFLPLELR